MAQDGGGSLMFWRRSEPDNAQPSRADLDLRASFPEREAQAARALRINKARIEGSSWAGTPSQRPPTPRAGRTPGSRGH